MTHIDDDIGVSTNIVIGYIVPRLDKSSYFVAHAANPINGSMTRTYGLAHGKMVGSLQPQDG